MSSTTATVQGGETTDGIAVGTLVGGRFLVERAMDSDALGTTLLARDQKTQKPIAIRVLSPELGSDAAVVERVRSEVKGSARAKHRVLIATYGVGAHAVTQQFVACEWAHGTSLADLVSRRAQTGRPLSVRGAYNVVAHVCKGLAELHGVSSCHGTLRPSVVMITRSGRVKVKELGLGLALVAAGRADLFPSGEQPYLAPEVKEQAHADARSDVFGVGAVLYTMLTGRVPASPMLPPSQLRDDVPPEVDAILERCLARDPAQRYAGTQEVAQALLPFSVAAPEADPDELGVDVEIDVDIAMSIAPPAPAKVVEARPSAVTFDPFAPAPRMAPPPVVPARAPSPVAEPAPLPAPPPVAPARPAVDFGDLMAKLTENDAPRWMTIKDGMDHGPFTARELVKLILDGEFLEQHGLFNMDTNERKPLGEWPELAEFVAQYKLRKADADHTLALEKSTKVERRSNAAKLMILISSIGAVLLVGGGYLMSRQAAKQREASRDIDLAAMFETGQVKIKGTAGILKYTARKGARKSVGGRAPSTSGGGPGFASYDDAMNVAMELGDATKGGGERQLTTSDVQGVMDKRLNALFSCVSEELRRGGRLGSVRIDLAILGSGQVAGASVNTGSGAFKGCISGKVRSIRFPSFPAPRMGARYSFDVN